MKKIVQKEKLAKVVNTRFPRIANYLKKLNKTKTLEQNSYNIVITLILHKVFFNTITTEENTNCIIEYIKEHYLRDYIILSQNAVPKTTFDFLLLKATANYKNEQDILDVTEEDLIQQYSQYNIDKLVNLKENLLKTYEAIKKEYKSIEIEE